MPSQADHSSAAELRQTPARLRLGLRVLYGVAVGYPLTYAAIHVLGNLNDHGLILLVLPLLLPLVAGILALSLAQGDWLSKLKQGLKQLFFVFLASFASTFGLGFLDIFHCGFGN